MSRKRHNSNKKPYIAVLLIAVLIIGVAAVFYAIANAPPKPIGSGLKVGDTFTFEIKGSSDVTDLNLVNSVVEYDFMQYNATDYYRITITDVNGTWVSLNSTWRFTNGTELLSSQRIDLATGEKTDLDGFYAIYASNITKGEKLRPMGADQTTINSTDTRTYTDSRRETNLFSLLNQFTNIQDPTGSTQRFDSIYIYWDKSTGMLVDLRNIQMYNNPEMTLTITWKLKETNAWAV